MYDGHYPSESNRSRDLLAPSSRRGGRTSILVRVPTRNLEKTLPKKIEADQWGMGVALELSRSARRSQTRGSQRAVRMPVEPRNPELPAAKQKRHLALLSATQKISVKLNGERQKVTDMGYQEVRRG